jgi:hypothetical protein
MKVLKIGLVIAFSLLVASTVLNLLYDPDINSALVAQHQMEMRQSAALQQLERQARSSTTRREGLAHRFDDWMHSLRSPRQLHRHSLSGGVKA